MADTNPYTQAAPRRNPGLIQRIASRLVKSDPGMGPQPAQEETTSTGVSHPIADFNDVHLVQDDDPRRQAIYRDADEMDRTSEEVSTALDVIADNLTTSEDGEQLAFEVHSDDQNVQDVLDTVVKTSKINVKIKQICRNFVKYGDVFVEPVVSKAGEITDARSLPPYTMYRNEDATGALATGKPQWGKDGRPTNKEGECAFEQRDEAKQTIIATFWPWQVLHARLNWNGFSVYGESQLRTTRGVWRQLKALIEALIMGRLTRDLLKLVFYVDTTGLSIPQKKQVLQEFRDSVANRHKVDSKRENPFSVLTDFYLSSGYVRMGGQALPMQTKLDVIDPKNEGIHDITDIKFLHHKLLLTLRIPVGHLWGEDLAAPGTLTQQDVQYVRWLRSVQRDVSTQILEPLFNLALILKGIDPKNTEYTISWPALRATDEAAAAQADLAFAQADQLYIQEGVLSPKWVQEHRYGMDPEEMDQIEQEMEKLQQQKLDQAQQMQQMMPQPAGGQPGQPPKQPAAGPRKGPNDNDGQRKGDEGRDSGGNRIAPTKSRKGLPNPTGAKHARMVKAAGEIDDNSALLVERLRGVARVE